ncbi:MAG: hypothetical protein ACLFP4_14940 [Spirochaetales bacterium]
MKRSPSSKCNSMRCLLMVTAFVLPASCGIPQIVVLEAPEVTRALRNPATVDFEHPVENDRDDFLGYELYYKFYEPSNPDSAFSGDRSAIENASPSAVISTLTTLGYRRVHALANGNQQPVVEVSAAERASQFTLTIDYPPNVTSTDTAAAIWSSSEEALARDLSLFGETESASFAPGDIELSDPDMPSDTTGAIGTIPMGLAVVAYGIDFTNNSFSAIYSRAAVADVLLEVYF